MLTVATVLKSGGLYDASWVKRLKALVARHLHVPHDFVCLSDVDVPCDRVHLVQEWPGWWSKIEVFKLYGPVLYLDLDTLIVGDLEDIAAVAEKFDFTVLRDFYRLGNGIGSGVMAWNGTNGTVTVDSLYEAFLRDPHGWMRKLGGGGDQRFIEENVFSPNVLRWQDLVDDQIVSYKVHCRTGCPPNARIVCLHGKPKFADMPVGSWARTTWEQAA